MNTNSPRILICTSSSTLILCNGSQTWGCHKKSSSVTVNFKRNFCLKNFPDVPGGIIIWLYFSSKNTTEGSCFLLNFTMLHFKDISGAIFVGLQASTKYRYFSQSLQSRCIALISLDAPEEVVHLHISHERAWLFCVKVSLGHIYFFQ